MNRNKDRELVQMQEEAKRLRKMSGLSLWTVAYIEDGMSISDISFIMDALHGYMMKTINRLEERGLIRTKTQGRSRIITLTEDGKKVKGLLNALKVYL